MPFNLSEDDFDLPADLRALGDRLSQESQQLAQVYPAGAPHDSLTRAGAAPADFPVFPVGPSLAPAKHSLASQAAALIVAAAGLAVLLACVFTFQLRSRSGMDHPAVVRAAPAENLPSGLPVEPPPALVSHSPPLPTIPAAAVAQPAWSSPAPQPAALLNASGPQLEGLFDLWERDSPQVATVSF